MDSSQYLQKKKKEEEKTCESSEKSEKQHLSIRHYRRLNHIK